MIYTIIDPGSSKKKFINIYIYFKLQYFFKNLIINKAFILNVSLGISKQPHFSKAHIAHLVKKKHTHNDLLNYI